MRFLALDLRNYGPFLNAPVLDLSGGERGLHLIIGPNEAGKSSALRAIRALLFDYPRSTPDDHGRDAATLRVGARVRGESGEEVAFLRRKRGHRFWTLDDRTSVAGDPLAAVLDGLDDSTFADLLSTDHAELLLGGREILRGGGKLGPMLFAASSGLAQLEQVCQSLQGEMDKLFKGSGNARIPAVNKGLFDLIAARAAVKKDALPTAEWVEAHNQLDRAIARRAEVARQRHVARAELDSWRSWLGALRVIPRRQEVLDRLAARESASVLRDGFAEAYRIEAEATRAAQRAIREAREARDSAEDQLRTAGPLDPILLEADAIARLHADLGRYAQARHDRPEVADRLARREDEVRSIRAELPASVALPTTGLGSIRDPIQNLGRDQAAIQAGQRAAEADLERLEPAGGDPLGPDSAGLDLIDRAAVLEAAIARIVACGDLEAQRLDARARFERATRQASTLLQGLSLWSGTIDELAALAIPPDATFDRVDADLRGIDDRIKAAEAERIALETKRIKLDREADRAAIIGTAPTLADLTLARDRRDDLWRSVRRAWVDREPLAPSPIRLADDLEARTRQADDLADRLRSEADRVAAHAQREVERRDLADRLALGRDTLDRARADRADLLQTWADLWRPLGIADPWPPREMKDWIRVQRAERLRAARLASDAGEEVERIDARIDQARHDLNHPLAQVDEPTVEPAESLAAALARGRIVVARIAARAERVAARGRLAAVAAQETAWLDRWRVALEPIGLPPSASVVSATAVIDRLGEWIEATRTARGLRDSLDDLDATIGRFSVATKEVMTRLGLDLEPSDVASPARDWQPVVVALVERLDLGRAAKTRRDQWLARLDEEGVKLGRAELARARADEALAALAAEAGCPAIEALPDAIRRSDEVADDLADLHRLDEQLDSFAGSMSRAELLDAVSDRDDSTLSAQISSKGDEVTAFDADFATIGEEIGGCKERLAAMDQRQGAAEAGQAVQDQAARIAASAEHYARLRLASAVLRESIERYRVKNQGPVLERAATLFAHLTAGSFTGLQTDLDDKGDPILRGVRGQSPGERAATDEAEPAATAPLVDVAAMSEGTADQLYLALRLACLSVHLDDHPPAPVVVDDILINFDDIRARAALEALADLSRRTQVLFFTHHDHLAEIARSCLPVEALFVHRLIPRSAAGSATILDETLASAPGGPKTRRRRAPAATRENL